MEKKKMIVFSWKDSRKLSLFCPSLTPLLAGADGVESQGHGHTVRSLCLTLKCVCGNGLGGAVAAQVPVSARATHTISSIFCRFLLRKNEDARILILISVWKLRKNCVEYIQMNILNTLEIQTNEAKNREENLIFQEVLPHKSSIVRCFWFYSNGALWDGACRLLA